jgi:DNA-directed RNA polymerase specialized sigma subunit
MGKQLTKKSSGAQAEVRESKLKQSTRHAERQLELQVALSRYDLWAEWFESHFCDLTEREKQVIRCYRNNMDTRDLIRILRASGPSVNGIYRRALEKLRQSEKDYYLWLIHQFIRKSGRFDFLDPEE